MKKVLVTGGAGYLGSILVPDLLRAGYCVTVIDNFLYKQNSLAHVCFEANFSIIRGDVRLEKTIRPLIEDADVIIPLAALVGAPLCNADPVGATSTNYDAIVTMLNIIDPSQYLIMPTTNSAYGTGDKNNYCDEHSELKPISQYAKEKVEVEKMIMDRGNSISFRLATVFGMSPRMRLDLLVNDFTYRAVHDRTLVLFESHFKRNYIHIRDVSRVFLHGIANFKKMKGEIYNVGLSDANLSKKELCETIKGKLPGFFYTEAPVGIDPDQRNYIVSNEKIESTGYKPRYRLDESIGELIKGYTMIKKSEYGNI